MPATVLNSQSGHPLVLVCDHASAAIPAPYNNLGVADADMQRHIAWDIGAQGVTHSVAMALGATAVCANFSRLFVDCNRYPHEDSAMPTESDNTPIPGNRALTAQERQYRIDRYFTPYHATITHEINSKVQKGITPHILAIHSFTPVYQGQARPWHAGVLWNKDKRLSDAIFAGFAAQAAHLTIGDNEPYSGKLIAYTLDTHGTNRGFANAAIEIRQDLIDSPQGIAEWAHYLVAIYQRALS
jgi:predicted N-formylglutamate amidohydrolase